MKLNASYLYSCINKKAKTAGGFHWKKGVEYIEDLACSD